MKWSRSASLSAAAVVLLVGAEAAARGDLPQWLQRVPAISRLQSALFRLVPMPTGPVLARRPPKETRAALNALIAQASAPAPPSGLPPAAELYALRAHAAEEQLDFDSAEADWKQFAQLAPDRGAGETALADFYHRRLRPLDEIRALNAAAQAPAPPFDRFQPASEQRAWQTFERIIGIVDAQALPADAAIAQYRAWIARYPGEQLAYRRFFDFLLRQKQFPAAENLIADYRKAFPADEVFPISARASLEQRRGSVDQAVSVYDRAFQPLWPAELVRDYFTLLKQTRTLRQYLQRARSALAANPGDLDAAVRVFYYYQQQGNLPAAQRTLLEFRQRKESRGAPWTADELFTIARLFEAVHNYDEAARGYYALYSLPGAAAGMAEKALAGIADVLFTAPEQPVRFGSGNLSFYRDVATMDPYPGFLNGILSLLLNSTQPQMHYLAEDQASLAYFHRARAAELLQLFDSRFPKSPQRSGLHAKLIQAYATYGSSDGVIRGGRQFLAAFPQAPERTEIALLITDAFARKGQVQDEFATYDALLKELAARADGVPLGMTTQPPAAREAMAQLPPGMIRRAPSGFILRQRAFPQPPGATAASTGARSPDYARVLDRYISRLVSMKRVPGALALLRRELDHNPNDPGLYERLAAFLDQNRLDTEVVQVYRRAIQQFSSTSWYDKLARWYLRRKQMAEFERLTQEVVNIFSGTELEAFFRDVVAPGGVGAALYLQVNLYAHQRFPYDLTFVRNLLNAYTSPNTSNIAAWEDLLRKYWLYDGQLRSRLFAFLSSRSRLNPEVESVRASTPAIAAGRWAEAVTANPVAARFYGEAEAWRSHFEAAVPALSAAASEYPGNEALGQRAAALNRSLAAFDPGHTGAAAAIEDKLTRFDPRNRAALTTLGEIYADRDLFGPARPHWDRIARIEPGRPDGYLEAATIYWDYFLFDDALRLIGEGRHNLSNPALFAYEAGAVYENKRDYTRAAEEYVKGALAAEGNSPARARLLQLAKRPAQRAIVDKLTAEPVSGPAPEPAAVSLRVAVLEAQERRPDLEKFLNALAGRAASLDLLSQVERIAAEQGLSSVEERSLERQIAVTADPVERIRLRLALARFYEGARNPKQAVRVIEAVYRDNPAILGVVRATADFYWRNKMERRAVDVLARAAGAANATLKKQFTLEAALKATESADYRRARTLLAGLLKAEPFEPEYLAAMADTYARQNDDRGLRDFYTAKIQELGQAPLPLDERNTRIAALRRGLIPALTRQKDYAEAAEQYIALLRSYPEDEGLAREAASYASAHNAGPRILGYFQKAVADSPRDYRWPMVVARLQTFFEDFPGAIAAYTRATEIRPDRMDLYVARASLEERLMRFDEAVRSYAKIYDLSYRNPAWMEKVAEIRARQGQADAAVRALRQALIEGRPERPQMFFSAARTLDPWDLLPQAQQFAEYGLKLAGNDLLADGEYSSGAQIYARIKTRLRLQDAAYKRLETLARAASGGPSLLPMQAALQEMGTAVNCYFTPEEKSAFQAFLEQQRPAVPPHEFPVLLVQLAQTAGLADLEARWRFELLMARPGQPDVQMQQQRLVELQQRRMRFDELGKQLEAYWNVHPRDTQRDALLIQAAESYRSAGDADAELRVLALKQQNSNLSSDLLERYFELLLARDPQRLAALAERGPNEDVRDRAANFALASGNRGLALRVIDARGRSLPPVWGKAYTGLAGLYYSDTAPAIDAAFRAALGAGTIGERIGKPVDRNQQLAGNIWFYYGTAYGEYLELKKGGDPEGYLPALLEGTPGNAAAYFALADYYRETGNSARALSDYEHTLELDPRRGDAHDRMAAILWAEGKRQEAALQWKAAFQAFRKLEDSRLPPTFWADVRETLEHIGSRGLLPAVQEDADRVLRTYIRRNGSYQVEPLLRGALAAAGNDPAVGVAWIADLSRAAADPPGFLEMVARASWLPEANREILYDRIVAAAEAQAAKVFGEARSYAEGEVRRWQVRRIEFLVETKQAQRAQAELDALPEDARKTFAAQIVPLEIRVAAESGRLSALLDRYNREPERTPPLDYLRHAAATLKTAGDAPSARALLELVYTRELDARNFSPSNFLGLAEVRLEQGDTAGAVALLRRMALVSGEPFEQLEPSASLLEKTGHPAEALEFLSARVRAVPWDSEARLRLARTQIAAGRDRNEAMKLLASVAGAREAPYACRAAAAEAGRGSGAIQSGAGSAELSLLAAAQPPGPAAAEQPFFYYARLLAAGSAADPAVRIRLLTGALAIEPEQNPPRLTLFRTALESGRDQLALAAMMPLLERSGLRYRLQRAESPPEEESSGEEPSYLARQFLAGAGLGTTQRAAAARGLGEASLRLGRLSPAALFFHIALELQPSAEMRAQVRQVRAEMDRRAMDARRRPVVKRGLEQEHLVRPRIVSQVSQGGGPK